MTVTGITTEISDHDSQLFEGNIGMSNRTKIKTLSTTRRKFVEENNVHFF